MRKNWVTTVGGILASVGALGAALPASNLQKVFVGLAALGVLLTGAAAKGQDEHSTAEQVQAASKPAPVAQG